MDRFRDQGHAATRRLPLAIKNHIVATISEFVGTFLFLLFAFGATNVVNSAPAWEQPIDTNANAAKLLYISLAFGLSLAVNVWAFFRIGGGQFNPAVTFAMLVTGSASIFRTAIVIVAQLLGAVCAAALVSSLFPGPLAVSTVLVPGMSIARGLFLEMFLTAELVFVIFMTAGEKNRATFVAPVCIGLALFIAELMGVYYTGGSLNPARSFGPCVATRSFPGYHWIYWLGPILGALLASGFYGFIKILEFGTASPDVDKVPGEGVSTLQPGAAAPAPPIKHDQFSEDTPTRPGQIANPDAAPTHSVTGVPATPFNTGPVIEAQRAARGPHV
ncbi:hypothetical protein NKR23_g3354 [Pleurostoma richardsiae]|uniref:Aquaporin n=1 Tax=Pleurostoma richardsiae TaxID=41990 RepID=A0AA38VTV7_9PEZI|nr:hypothetical protein NKR23_g3354 [Pleurostoma richardsiae]